MDLAEIQCLPIEDKLKWIRTPDGLVQLSKWLSAGLLLKDVAQMLEVSSSALYRWRTTYPEIAEIVVRAGYKEVKSSKPNLSRPSAYRLICGLDYNNRGTILNEFDTAEELWNSPSIHNYFRSYDVSPADYFESYLAEIRRTGRYTLSNSFSLVYGTVNKRGILKTLTQTVLLDRPPYQP